MSYCRFSSDNWRSDVYVYAHCDGGYVVHVAYNRYVSDVPCPPLAWDEPTSEFAVSCTAQRKWLDNATLVKIGLPHDGDQFGLDTAAECADKLEELQAIGYHVPDGVIDALRKAPKHEQLDLPFVV